MKNTFKKITCAAALIMLALTVAGCGGQSAESMAKKALKNLNKKDSAQIESLVKMTAGLSSPELGELQMSAEQTSTVEYTTDPKIIHTHGAYNQKLDGEDLSTTIDEYQVVENEKTVTYTGLENFWMRREGGTSIKDLSESILNIVAEKKGSADLADATQEVEGQEAYDIHVSIPASEIPEIMSTAEGMLGQIAGDSGQMPEITGDLWISKETGLPVLIMIDMKACGNYLIRSIEGASGEFTEYTMSITYKSFNTVETLELPQQAKDSAIDTDKLPIQGGDGSGIGAPETESRETTGYDVKAQINDDGKYELHLESADNVAYVGIPDGFMEDMSSLYHLSLISDSYERVDYTFADMYSADSIAEEYKEMMSYIENDDMYSNVQFSDTKSITAGGNTVSYVCLTYTYGAAAAGSDGAGESAESGGAGSVSGGDTFAEYLTWTENNGILFTVQISGLKKQDENLVKRIYKNISFQ